MVNPTYTDLWNTLKQRHVNRISTEEPDPDLFSQLHHLMPDEYPSAETPITLPIRRVELAWDGDSLLVLGKRKAVKHDFHAANFLEKLDTDDDYFAQFTSD